LGFARARQLVPYLHALGIETLYLSPVTMAAPGSSHGYDVIDPTRPRPRHWGSDKELEALLGANWPSAVLAMLIDVVPNHMAAVAENPWWWDVLATGEGGLRSPATSTSTGTRYHGRVLLPVLGRSLAEVIADAELEVAFENGGPRTVLLRPPVSRSIPTVPTN